MTRTHLSLAGAAALALALPATADATILVNVAPGSQRCADAIRTGVWNRPDGQAPASRVVRVTIRSAAGRVVARHTFTAGPTWRYWRYRGACGRSYRVTYANPQFGTQSYRVTLRR